jgi:hypothetical protein
MIVKFSREKKIIVRFVIDYETLIHEKWTTVMRFDNSHGRSHRHSYYSQNQPVNVPLNIDSTEAFHEAIKFIKHNYLRVKDNFIFN